LTSTDLLQLGIADEVIPEPPGGAHADWDATATSLRTVLTRQLSEIGEMGSEERRANRWRKFEAMGAWHDGVFS
jgi:acetyl-CoA carboxylase carboxyl transferase subunit alpha